MEVTRDVIVDLLPLYIAGEASAATRALIDEYLNRDPELAKSVRSSNFENLLNIGTTPLEPRQEIEITALRRTRGLIRWQRRLYAWGIALSLVSLSSVFHFDHGHVRFQIPAQ